MCRCIFRQDLSVRIPCRQCHDGIPERRRQKLPKNRCKNGPVLNNRVAMNSIILVRLQCHEHRYKGQQYIQNDDPSLSKPIVFQSFLKQMTTVHRTRQPVENWTIWARAIGAGRLDKSFTKSSLYWSHFNFRLEKRFNSRQIFVI